MDLPVDFPRLGYLYEPDDHSRTEMPGRLQVDPDGTILIDVPFPAGSADQVGRWFHRAASPCPSHLLFQDHRLDFHLIGAFVTGRNGDADYQPGVGTLHADYAVEDGDRSQVDYREVEAVLSRIDGLHEFMAWNIAEFDFAAGPAGDETVLRAKPPEVVSLGTFDGFELAIAPSWWARKDRPNVSSVGESTALRTRSTSPRPLDDHLVIHRAIRDLLALCMWRPVDFEEVRVQRQDAPARTLDGQPRAPAWRRLHGTSLRRRHSTEVAPQLHFSDVRDPANFESVGKTGLLRWLDLRADLARMTDPLLALLYAPTITPVVALMQTSIAAEALGYLRATAQGLTDDQAAGQSFRTRLRGIATSQPLAVGDIVVDREHWLTVAADAYNGVKHANRQLPEPPLPTLIARTLIALLRSHLLLQLGTTDSRIENLATHAIWWGQRQPYADLADWPDPPEAGT